MGSYGTFYWIQILPIKCHYANFVLSITELHDQSHIKRINFNFSSYEIVISSGYQVVGLIPIPAWPNTPQYRAQRFDSFWTFCVLSLAPTICKYIVTLIAWYANVSSCASSQWPSRLHIFLQCNNYHGRDGDCYKLDGDCNKFVHNLWKSNRTFKKKFFMFQTSWPNKKLKSKGQCLDSVPCFLVFICSRKIKEKEK